jgi:hypothetical protein
MPVKARSLGSEENEPLFSSAADIKEFNQSSLMIDAIWELEPPCLENTGWREEEEEEEESNREATLGGERGATASFCQVFARHTIRNLQRVVWL